MGFGDFLGGIPVVGGLAKGAWDTVSGAPGDLWDDYQNSGKNHYTDPGYQVDPRANQNAQAGVDSNAVRGDWAYGQSQANRGPQAVENAGLLGNEAGSRGSQQNALGLMQGAANGTAPSAAQGVLNQGTNAALAQQSAIAGSARGSAGIALAGAQQAGTAANITQNAGNQASILRANEMAQARQAYGQQANDLRSGDQSRIQQNNQNNQFNSQLNDQYRLGMSNVANAYGQTGLGFNNSLNQGQQIGADVYNAQQDRRAGVQGYNAAQKKAQSDRLINTGLGLGNTAVGAAGGNATPMGQK